MNRLLLAVSLAALLLTPCQGDTYRVSGVLGKAPVSGTAFLELEPLPQLRLMLGERVLSLSGQAEETGSYRFQEATQGVAGALTQAPPGLTLTLKPTPEGFRTEPSQNESVERGDQLELVRVDAAGKPRVLLLPSRHFTGLESVLLDYARRLKGYYAPRGHPVDILQPETAQDVVDHLERAALDGVRYRRLVFIGHGGWDGPTFNSGSPSQMSSRSAPERFEAFVAALNATLTPEAKVYVSACHAAGSDRVELAAQTTRIAYYNWVIDLARRTKRTIAGPAGPTSTDYTSQHVLAVLEGTGTVRQEVHVSNGSNLRIVLPGRTLARARAEPLRELELTTKRSLFTTLPPVISNPPVINAPVISQPVINVPLGRPN